MWWLGTMESDTVSESLTDQVGGILKVRVTSIQKLDTGFSGGILKFQTLVSQWDTEKKCQFQTLWFGKFLLHVSADITCASLEDLWHVCDCTPNIESIDCLTK